MKSGYELCQYRSEHSGGVLALLSGFWGGDLRTNEAYLKWKYEDNPNTDKALAYVALRDGEVVGFRGYFATRWHIMGDDCETVVLSPGDTFVRSDHRGSGLSISMGRQAMREYSSTYKVFLNLSSSRASVPGYLKMGFTPLALKTYLNLYSTPGVIKFFVSSLTKSISRREVAPGQIGNIIVQKTPRPQDMSEVISSRNNKARRLSLIQNKAFFQWRFSNELRDYLFYYQREENRTTGYLVIRCSPNGHRGYIVDYASVDDISMKKMFEAVAGAGHFDILSVLNVNLDEDFLRLLRRIGFRARGLMATAEKRKRGEWPMLVRTVREDCVEEDWFVGGLDIRRNETWDIKEICSDGV